MSARDAARAIAIGRVVAGASLVARPGPAGRGWLGADADRPPVRAALRSMGVRDLVLGALTLHVAGRPGIGYRTVVTCAAVDAVDCAAFYAARDHLPAVGGWAVIAVAGGAAVGGLAVAAGLRR